MQEKNRAATDPILFRDFLRNSWLPILVILLLALCVRMAFVIPSRPAYNDALFRYIATATNILDGHGFTLDHRPPYRPGDSVVPLYPLFIAANYALLGRHELAVKVVQVLLDLLTGVLVAFISFNLAPERLKNPAAFCALIIYGILSWFTFIWTTYVLTETLAIFLTTLTITLGIIALQKGGRFWFYAGLVCGLAMLTRPDSVLLLIAVVLFLTARAMWRRTFREALYALVFCVAAGLALLPWTARNYFVLGKFQPLASEYGLAQPAFMATGYLSWIRTWMTDETYFVAFDPAFAPPGATFDPGQLPASAFDSTEERRGVESLIARYNQQRHFTPDIDEEFRQLAADRVRRAPVRFFIVLPAIRIASLWLTGFSTSNPTHRLLRILSVLPIIIGGILGFALWGRCQSQTSALLLSVILTRTLFMGFHYAPETRYIVEAYPLMIAACAMTLAAIWLYARKVVAGLIAARPSHNSPL